MRLEAKGTFDHMLLWKRRWVGSVWAVAAALILVSLALLAPAIFTAAALSGDSSVHILWQSQFPGLVWNGTPYPRWLPDMNHGFGSPAFFFYPPLLQWVGALFAPFAPSAGNATLRIALALGLLSAAGGLGTWFWLRTLRLGAGAALLGALVYLLIPYRAYFDIYQRGALPELAGISVMPWLLCFAQRLRSGGAGAWGGYALSTGVILYSHLPAAEIGILFATCYAVVLADREDWFRFLFRAGTATVAGFLIGALCIAPALGLLGYIPNPANMWGPRQQPANWLLFSGEAWADAGVHSVVVVLCLLSLAMGIALGLLTWRPRAPRLTRLARFLTASIFVVLLLNTEPARWFWELQTPLSRIQFPFRLLSLHGLAFAGLAAIALDQAHRSAHAWARRVGPTLWVGVFALLLGDVALFGLHAYYGRYRPPTNAAIIADTRDTGEYVIGSLEQLEKHFGSAPIWPIDAAATATPVRWQPRALALEVNATAPSRVALRQFAFTGWRCRVDDGPWQAPAALPQPLNVPLCQVPQGRHSVEAEMQATWIERLGAIAALVGLLLALADIVRARLRRRPELASV